jgi:myo-inositol 2-dehydrogenase/D-chiro-inositol 1-dehydrogenase
MGTVHLAACGNSELLQVTAVADSSERTRTELAGAGLRCYPDADSLIAAGGIDAVIIATPTPTHQELSARLLAAGLPVLCEKPCGPSAAGLRRLGQIAEAVGAPLRIGYWRRFVPELGELRTEIRQGRLGGLLTLETGQWDERPPSPEYARQCGSIFADMAVHDLDQIQWLAGERITEVRALVRTGASSPLAGQAALLALSLESGLIAAASFGRWFPGGDTCWIRVHGTAGFRDLHFLRPPYSDDQMRSAVRAQDEAFAALVRGSPDERLATAADAEAALKTAETAEAAGLRRLLNGAWT